MIKQYKKELIVSTLLALLPIAAGGCFCGTGFPVSLPPIGA